MRKRLCEIPQKTPKLGTALESSFITNFIIFIATPPEGQRLLQIQQIISTFFSLQ